MATRTQEPAVASPLRAAGPTNGAALAAFLAAGIGAFTVGFVVLLVEVGLLSLPTLYQPAGGVSSRTTAAVVVWLVAWAVLHARWKDRELDAGRIFGITLALVLLGVLFTFPPLWGLLPGS